MKIVNLFLLLSFIGITAFKPMPVSSAAAQVSAEEPYSGDTLCLPGAYLNNSQDCLPYGPSEYITDLAEKGIEYPLTPLNSKKIDASLGILDYSIAKINVFPPDRAAIYSSVEDASEGGSPVKYMQAGQLLYVSYSGMANVDGNEYVLTASGGWMRASPASYISFRGVVFDQPPRTSFGWIVESTYPLTAPSYNAPQLETQVNREDLVQIYDIAQADGVDYYMIGVNEWVQRRYIRQLVVNTTPPEGVEGGRWIELNLYEQTLAAYENYQLKYATLIASGVDPYFTRPGLFQIKEKKPTETMTGAFAADRSDYYYLEAVPWTMYFDEARAIHGAYWRAWLGYPQSHGCVNMSVADSHWIYDWANVGDWVYVWDPSGETPTDPALYTEGGA